MNDKALDDAYRMFVQSGYRKSKAEFYALLASNPNAFNDAYKLFSNSGYKGSQDEFATLLGVGQGLEVGPKKKTLRNYLRKVVLWCRHRTVTLLTSSPPTASAL